MQQQTLDELLLLQSYLAYDFPGEGLARGRQGGSKDVLRTLSYLHSMDDVGEGLRQTYKKALAKGGGK